MTYAVIYASATGNTKMLAEEIRKRLGKKECVCFGTVEEAGTAVRADIIFAGFWTDKGDCSEELGHFLERLHGRRVFLFGTAGFGGAQSYFDQILERVKDCDDRPLLNGAKNVEHITKLMEARRPKYEAAADIIIATDGKSASEICREIVGKLQEV